MGSPVPECLEVSPDGADQDPIGRSQSADGEPRSDGRDNSAEEGTTAVKWRAIAGGRGEQWVRDLGIAFLAIDQRRELRVGIDAARFVHDGVESDARDGARSGGL